MERVGVLVYCPYSLYHVVHCLIQETHDNLSEG